VRYIPHTEGDVQRMLEKIGVASLGELFAPIPGKHRLERPLDLPRAAAEQELLAELKDLAARNASTETHAWFLGAGTYPHFIPSAVDAIASRSEFYTAYTPYQAEISQGTLQAIFEWQTMICGLTGLEVANASMYDGASATAEAALMAMRTTQRSRVVLASTIHPHYRDVVRTYLRGLDAEIVEAPRAARKVRAGQFVIVRVDEEGERIPFTVAEKDPQRGTIAIVFQTVGYSTRQMAKMEVGESLADVLGPLGQPTEVRRHGRVVCVAGGVGIAFIYPEIVAFAEAGNEIVSILGARTKDLLFYVEEIRALSSELHLATDDGSLGRHGVVTDVLRDLLGRGERYDYCIAIGPIPMMRAAVELTKQHDLPTLVSLDPIMVDGTGMCGACRVTVGGEVKFACVDGPDFDGHLVDFDELAKRKRAFVEEEERCRLQAAADTAEEERARSEAEESP